MFQAPIGNLKTRINENNVGHGAHPSSQDTGELPFSLVYGIVRATLAAIAMN